MAISANQFITRKSKSVVLMLNDTKNLHLANLIYENFGTKEIIVRTK